jgi:hypothetical protein
MIVVNIFTEDLFFVSNVFQIPNRCPALILKIEFQIINQPDAIPLL